LRNPNIVVFIFVFGIFLLPALSHADSPAPLFFQSHQLWDSGPDIQLLQQFLNAQGFIVAQDGPTP
jgi:hypothetical protein